MIRSWADSSALRHRRDDLAARVEALVEAYPPPLVLTEVTGIGVRTCARFRTQVTGKHFAGAAHSAPCAGVAPVTRRSGTSIRGEHTSRSENKKLKRALFLPAFSALDRPHSRAYDDRKRAEGKRRNRALVALARRRSDVLFACSGTQPPARTRTPEHGRSGTQPSPGLLQSFPPLRLLGVFSPRAAIPRPLSAAAPPPSCRCARPPSMSKRVGSLASVKGRPAFRMVAGPVGPDVAAFTSAGPLEPKAAFARPESRRCRVRG